MDDDAIATLEQAKDDGFSQSLLPRPRLPRTRRVPKYD